MQRAHRSNWSRFVRCLLVVAAWQAPLPLWHTHGTLANATAESASWLAEHLRTHHPTIEPSSQTIVGWHCHFVDPQSGGEPPDAPKRNPRHVVVACGPALLNGVSRLQAPLVSWAGGDPSSVSGVPATGLHAVRHRARGFFTDFAPDMPLPARLGVLHC